MKAIYSTSLMAAAVIIVPVRASQTDGRIESSARKSYVFKTMMARFL